MEDLLPCRVLNWMYVIGKLEYMLTEQAELYDLDIDPRAGVYVLGMNL